MEHIQDLHTGLYPTELLFPHLLLIVFHVSMFSSFHPVEFHVSMFSSFHPVSDNFFSPNCQLAKKVSKFNHHCFFSLAICCLVKSNK